MKLLSNTIKITLLNTTTRVAHMGTRLSSKFNFKDREKLEKVHNAVYQAMFLDCIGETVRCLEERIEEHARKIIT